MILTYTTADLPAVLTQLELAITDNDDLAIDRLVRVADELWALKQSEDEASDPDRLIERYEAEGMASDEAEAKATGRSLKSVRRSQFKSWAHSEGFTGDDYRGLVTQAHDAQAETDYYAAERATNGHMVKAQYRDTVNPASFWYTNSVQYVRKHASEELLAWFDEFGRATWQALHDSIIAGGSFIAKRTGEDLLR